MAENPRVIMFQGRIAARVSASVGGAFQLIAPEEGQDLLGWLGANGRGVEVAILSPQDRLDAAMLDRMPDLRHVQVFGAGMDGMDLEEAARRGVAVESSGHVHAREVADFAVMMMLAARRELHRTEQWLHSGDWGRHGWVKPSRSMNGAKIGIVGLGHIGEAIAERIEPFTPEIRWWGPNPKPARWPRVDELIELARWSDILFLAARSHASLTGLISREVIEAVGSEGLIVNIARGFMIDEDALIAALRDGRLGQAALDVFDVEPTPPERWVDVPNAILTAHAAGSTRSSYGTLESHVLGRVREELGL